MTELPQSSLSPLPAVDEESAPHWQGIERGVLTLRRCDMCDALNHPMADTCRSCQSPQLRWEDVGTQVRLFSWVVEMRGVIQGMNFPYVVAQVTPAECEDGEVRLIGTLLSDPEELELGMSLRLLPVLAPGSDRYIATYVPA